MTDHELLVFAAKAAGINLYWQKNEFFGMTSYQVHDGVSAGPTAWNPLQNDADAFRLVTKLGMTVMVYDFDELGSTAVMHQALPFIEPHQTQGNEKATRRAIVRAAAEAYKISSSSSST